MLINNILDTSYMQWHQFEVFYFYCLNAFKFVK